MPPIPAIKVEYLPGPLNDGKHYQTQRLSLLRKVAFGSRSFLCFDGEGVTVDNQHYYILLGAGNKEHKQSIHSENLSTLHCFQFLMRMQEKYPTSIKVAFAFNYDVNMMLKDVSEHQLELIGKGEWGSYGRYRIKWLKSKWFELRYRNVAIKIYDTFTFFGCSFMAACTQYLGDNEPELQEVADGKALRSEFEYSELDNLIRPYMYKELSLLDKLITQLRTLLHSIDLDISGWHGPGAIASALLKKHSIKSYRPKTEHPIIETAAQFAYIGGRFELFRTGRYDGPVFQFDMRSAYPYALTQCPALTDKYYLSDDITDIPDFSLAQVTYFNLDSDRTSINPFPLRSDRQAVYYPGAVSTWVWGCELKAALKWFGPYIEIHQVMRFDDDGTRPFEFINDLYSKRAEWKRIGNPAQLACKLGMNSVYGKLAQRVGWNETDMLAPAFHQLRWAGYTTAKCRSMALDAMMQAPEHIIAVETDGVFSTVPLKLDEGQELGQWESTIYDAILFMQSGVYFTLQGDDWSKGKTRGFSANKTNIEIALAAADELLPMITTQHKFMGLPGRLGKDDWRQWSDTDHVVNWGGGGKRAHIERYCKGCSNGSHWHDTSWTIPNHFISTKHLLPWQGE